MIKIGDPWMILIGECAGHHFHGQADIQTTYHCSDGERVGYYFVRKRLVDRSAFNYDSRLGWEYDRWFEWKDSSRHEKD